MIRKRDTSGTGNDPVPDVIINTDNIKKAPSPQEIKTYKDEAIMVLNILEKSNVDIYDPENKPGMYLKRKGNSKIPLVFKQKPQKISEEEKFDSKNLANLFQHFQNNKSSQTTNNK